MGEAVIAEQRATLELLAEHMRLGAYLALSHPAASSFRDFMLMRSMMIAGGLHQVRLYGGRSIESARSSDRRR